MVYEHSLQLCRFAQRETTDTDTSGQASEVHFETVLGDVEALGAIREHKECVREDS